MQVIIAANSRLKVSRLLFSVFIRGDLKRINNSFSDTY